jgi:CRISPR-associated protein Cst2
MTPKVAIDRKEKKMSVHVFGAIVTARGIAANNRGTTEGHVGTLQKLVWNGEVHTTVSAESIRFSLRRNLGTHEQTNRTYDDDTRTNAWRDPKFSRWNSRSKETPFIDDDLLGYMATEGAKEEGQKGSISFRRARLELTRAVSLEPWPGDVTFNAASPGATPSAQKKGSNPVPYATEMHATRYQYGFALTPSQLRVPKRAVEALRGLCALGEVAGNHGRFLFDFSPESLILRVTHDPAPRILFGFETRSGSGIGIDEIIRKTRAGDIAADELVVGGGVVSTLGGQERAALKGAALHEGIRAACEDACRRFKVKP